MVNYVYVVDAKTIHNFDCQTFVHEQNKIAKIVTKLAKEKQKIKDGSKSW